MKLLEELQRLLVRMFATKLRWIVLSVIGTVFIGGCITHNAGRDWRTASREPAGLAPSPATTPEAVVQVYAARTVSWRGYFGVHTWIAAKPSHADQFTVYEVIGYRLRRTGNVVVVHHRPADGYWFGARPELLSDLRGEGVDEIIGRIEDAVKRYPYPDKYHAWPGPNSNTFVAFVTREVPELRVDLPPTAIGKDYLGLNPVAMAPSGTGGQLNVFGLAGVLVGVEEGVEVNLLGLTFGLDPKSLSLKLPVVGRIGPGGDADPVILPPVIHPDTAAANAAPAVPVGDAAE